MLNSGICCTDIPSNQQVRFGTLQGTLNKSTLQRYCKYFLCVWFCISSLETKGYLPQGGKIVFSPVSRKVQLLGQCHKTLRDLLASLSRQGYIFERPQSYRGHIPFMDGFWWRLLPGEERGQGRRNVRTFITVWENVEFNPAMSSQSGLRAIWVIRCPLWMEWMLYGRKYLRKIARDG